MTPPPALVISLDFELHWGVRDHTSVDGYRENLLGVREAIPAMLALFERRGIAATWATVGMLFARTKRELEAAVPARLPRYVRAELSPYAAFGELGEDETKDPFHFGASLVEAIARTPRQEIATHTFSHYYCLEPGQTEEDFEADLLAARAIGAPYGDVLGSIVFPRNQENVAYRRVLERVGVKAFRSNGAHWAYVPTSAGETPARRGFRLADAYLPLSGARTAAAGRHGALVDVPASAFLRPYAPRLRRLDPVRGKRLAWAMRRAAKRREIFHLWWHPHNFGAHPRESLAFLELLLDVFDDLRRSHGMLSLGMRDAAEAA